MQSKIVNIKDIKTTQCEPPSIPLNLPVNIISKVICKNTQTETFLKLK